LAKECVVRRVRIQRLPANAVKGVTKTILSCETDIVAGRNECTAFTRLFFDDAFRTRRKVFKSDGGRRLLRCHSRKQTR